MRSFMAAALLIIPLAALSCAETETNPKLTEVFVSYINGDQGEAANKTLLNAMCDADDRLRQVDYKKIVAEAQAAEVADTEMENQDQVFSELQPAVDALAAGIKAEIAKSPDFEAKLKEVAAKQMMGWLLTVLLEMQIAGEQDLTDVEAELEQITNVTELKKLDPKDATCRTSAALVIVGGIEESVGEIEPSTELEGLGSEDIDLEMEMHGGDMEMEIEMGDAEIEMDMSDAGNTVTIEGMNADQAAALNDQSAAVIANPNANAELTFTAPANNAADLTAAPANNNADESATGASSSDEN